MQNETLEEQIGIAIKMWSIPKKAGPQIENNLNPGFRLRPYQVEAFARFEYYMEKYPQKIIPTQLLFHMATGSGKTIIMAGCILSLYRKGYRNFIFFVNSNTIIGKTRDNFINAQSSKYLFNDSIIIDAEKVNVVEVDNFENFNKNEINIVFTTVQGLHLRLNMPKENGLTYEDFEEKEIVLISDEAHHINAQTKRAGLTREEIDSLISWESTVNKVFKSNKKNILLEFTATTDLSNEEINKKYKDKLLFDYPLRQFRLDKYSKEVQVLQADLSPIDRAIQAVILNQFRRKVFEKYKIHIKPVILFKSKTIIESQKFFIEFVRHINSITTSHINKIRDNNSSPVIKMVFDYFDTNGITSENLIHELQVEFSQDKCIAVDSKNDTEEKQLIINSLEDKGNEYRAIFAVDKLNEGWDVLNLFDIVRLYDTRDAGHRTGKVGKTTISEAQLIGRGARYCPFQIFQNQPLYRRKYDDDLTNELRIGEELYYHSHHNPKYISELNKALEEIGLKPTNTIQKELLFKDKFKASENTNDQIDIYELKDAVKNKIYKKKLLTGYTTINRAFGDDLHLCIQKSTRIYKFSQFPDNIIIKAINQLPFYRFSNLQKYFPHLKSIEEFVTSPAFIKELTVEVEGTTEQIENPTNTMKLQIAVSVLDEVAHLITQP